MSAARIVVLGLFLGLVFATGCAESTGRASPTATGGPLPASVSLFAHPVLVLSPGSVPHGGVVEVSGESNRDVCQEIQVTLHPEGETAIVPLTVASQVVIPVTTEGRFRASLPIPIDLKAGIYSVRGGCLNGGSLAGTPSEFRLQVVE